MASATSLCSCWGLSCSSIAMCLPSLERTETACRCACAGVRAQREIPSHPRLSLQVDQSGLGLPSRDYYLNKTENEKVGVPLQRVAPAQTTSPSVFPQCTHLCRSLKLEEHRGVPYLAVPGRGGVSFVPILE